jgi:hypothetical protein
VNQSSAPSNRLSNQAPHFVWDDLLSPTITTRTPKSVHAGGAAIPLLVRWLRPGTDGDRARPCRAILESARWVGRKAQPSDGGAVRLLRQEMAAAFGSPTGTALSSVLHAARPALRCHIGRPPERTRWVFAEFAIIAQTSAYRVLRIAQILRVSIRRTWEWDFAYPAFTKTFTADRIEPGAVQKWNTWVTARGTDFKGNGRLACDQAR